MRATIFVLSGLTLITACIGLLASGSSEIFKLVCLFITTAWGVTVSRRQRGERHWKAGGAAALGTAVVFAVLGVISVFLADWQSHWYERIPFALYIGAMAGLFFGAIGGLLGFISDLLLRSVKFSE